MEFLNKETGTVRNINEPLLHLSKDDELVGELIKMNYKYDELSWYINADLSFKDAIKIKVNIKDVGYIIAYFDKDFDHQLRKDLIENIFELKMIDVNKSFDTLKKKLSSILNYINECHPLFGVFMINNYHEEVEKILKEMEGSIFSIYYFDVESEPKEEAPLVEKVKTKEKDNLLGGFKKSLKTILKYKIEHAFNALYSMLISICLLLAAVYIDNNNKGIGLLFICFAALFVILIAYNLHLYYVDNKKIFLFDYLFFVGFSLISVVIGILLGYALVKGLVKFGDTPINYSKNIKLAIILSIPALLGSHLLRLLISFIYRKIKASK